MLSKKALVGVLAAAIGLIGAVSAEQIAFLPPTNSSRLDTEECLSCTSCSNDACNTNTPGGLLLLTQFWDYSPPIGPSDSWTIHGLWPDFCNGKWVGDCDKSRVNNRIASILNDAGATDVLDTMNQYWLALDGNDQRLWSHEWNKHGTCVSTLRPTCYENYTQDQDVVDFFSTTVGLFEIYNIHQALAEADITPSSSQTYSLQQILDATEAKFGKAATFKCRGSNLNEAWIYFHTVGRSTDPSAFRITDPLTENNRCPSTGIRYPPK
ncbi:base non-specific and adenylic acid preferential ribonuclease [Testicularia cyperi]|uniref:ribonuclease T2 n=1 Tax=Testicularia cyperi TaxID=1882483 RepID=A0A317XPF3_9BASI|nr:base non-specific and adenylic acid preferential ribonuclease [Testicularia cyperi]